MGEDRITKAAARRAARKSRHKSYEPQKIDVVETASMHKPERFKDELRLPTGPDVSVYMPTGAEVQNKSGLAGVTGTNAPSAVTATPTTADTSSSTTTEDKTKTFEEMLADLRKSALQEKTDALKMQKYHALADVFNSIGKMGGAVAGGAIGGNVLDSAPTAGEYKASKGYLDAFEKTKEADNKIRSLDDTGFKLALTKEERAYNQKLRDDERAYKAAVTKAENEFRSAENQLERNFKVQLTYLNAELAEAAAVGDAERKEATQIKIENLKNEHAKELATIKGDYDLAVKNIGLQIAETQAKTYRPDEKILFSDGSTLTLSNADYESLKNNLIGEIVDGEAITAKNVDYYIKRNPTYVKMFLRKFNIESKIESEENGKPATTRAHKQASSPYYFYNWIDEQKDDARNKPSNFVEINAATANDAIKKDISTYKM